MELSIELFSKTQNLTETTTTKRDTILGASTATWFFVVQACLVTAGSMIGEVNAITTAIVYSALALSLAGYCDCIRFLRRGEKMQSFHRCTLSTVALFFWSTQLILVLMRVPS
jgi:hypothetical protein